MENAFERRGTLYFYLTNRLVEGHILAPTSLEEQLATLTRNAVDVLPEEGLKSKLSLGRPLRVKLGLDPTAEHVTLGWAVVLRQLREFQKLGHQAVLIVGDFTARIGDPSLENKTRPMLTKEQVDAFSKRVLDQLFLILDRETTELRYNSEWLETLGVEGFLELTTHQTVAHTLQRDDFAERFGAGASITLREMVYPLLQGYDSVAVQADVELGGTDQLFNLLVGRDLQRVYGQDPQVVLTTPLIEGTDGVAKMSQSLGNYVAVTEQRDDMFGKLMRVPDQLMEKYFRLTTELSDDEIAHVLTSERPERAKRRMASEVVKLYHGDEAAAAAEDRFDRIFVKHEQPDEVLEMAIPDECVSDGKVDVPALLFAIGLASSKSDARRKISQGGVRVGDMVIETEQVELEVLTGATLQVGKRHFVRLV